MALVSYVAAHPKGCPPCLLSGYCRHSPPCLLASAAQHATAGEPLPSLNVDLTQTTVSGLSSGAYMAGQFHIAFSAEVTGAGIVAGGPYGCAEGRAEVALERCMATDLR